MELEKMDDFLYNKNIKQPKTETLTTTIVSCKTLLATNKGIYTTANVS